MSTRLKGIGGRVWWGFGPCRAGRCAGSPTSSGGVRVCCPMAVGTGGRPCCVGSSLVREPVGLQDTHVRWARRAAQRLESWSSRREHNDEDFSVTGAECGCAGAACGAGHGRDRCGGDC